MKISAIGTNSLRNRRDFNKGNYSQSTQQRVAQPSFQAVPKKFDKELLIILDGFGVKKGGELNPFDIARMPFYKSLVTNAYGDTLYRPIEASGIYVGLPPKLPGSSEVGHNNLGAGRMIPQDLMVIDDAIKDRSFYSNKAFLDAMRNSRENNKTLHLMTLLSDGYVHSSIRHLHELIRMAANQQVQNVKVHAFLDGRDCLEGTAKDFARQTNEVLRECNYGDISSFIGMKYPMDRSRNWSNTNVAYNLLVNGKSQFEAKSFDEIYERIHTGSNTSETGKWLEKDMPPVKLEGFEPIRNGDSVIFTNYRNDRTRQLTDAITQRECTAPFLEGQPRLEGVNFVCMTEYDPSFHLPVAFPAKVHSNTLTQVLNDQKFNPWVTAETEKKAHVTFFFDGKRHVEYSDTSYIFPASDHSGNIQPEMEATTIRDTIMSWMDKDRSRAMIVNFANPDMIGHDNNFEKGVQTLNLLDRILFRILDNARERDIATIITADHGNIEDMTHGGHTNNPVPFISVLPGCERFIEDGTVFLDKVENAAISRVAPSFLDLLNGAKKPEVMYDSMFKMPD
jgi:2,3-bisphosphoglycerate-independent phosphoglycerate mutase